MNEQGIIARGYIDSPPFQDTDFNRTRVLPGKPIWYVKIRFDRLYEDPCISRRQCEQTAPACFPLPFKSGLRWNPQHFADILWRMLD